MAVVIRLQGLRIEAGSEDIRNFFSGLKIPDGGVHIIGGVLEEAYIIFASDEDARRAMRRSGGCIRGSPINLMLSSKSEMQSILEESTKNAELEQKGSLRESSRHHEVDVSRGARRADYMQTNRGDHHDDHDMYLHLRGMPFSVTEKDVYDFFHGLLVEGIILKQNARGQYTGEGLVKFATVQDARDGLMRDKEYIGSRYVDILPASQQKWLESGGDLAVGVNGNGKLRRGGSPTRSPRYPQARTRSRSPVAMPIHSPRYPQARPRSRSPLAPPTRSPRYTQARTRSSSPLPNRPTSPSNQDFCVLLENLSHGVEKCDIKTFFKHARLEDDQILFLLDTNGGRTRSLFVLFNSLGEYSVALTRHNDKIFGRSVNISPISRKKMMSILESNTRRPDSFQERRLDQQANPHDSEKVCLYVRNMPFDVHKVEIMEFFFGFNITEDKVFLLRDHNGTGLGEALVVFQSEGEAMSAQSLNGQRFLGTEVMLNCISLSQMREFGVEPPAAQESMMLREERYSSRKSEVPHYPGDMEVENVRMPTDGNRTTSGLQVNVHRGGDPCAYAPQDGGNGSVHRDFGLPASQVDGPTRVKLGNLPLQVKKSEIYDFCYGYRVVPGSVDLPHKGTATVVFESREEALTAVKELSGRPIGPRKIHLMMMKYTFD